MRGEGLGLCADCEVSILDAEGSRFFGNGMLAADVNHDGDHELVVTMAHHPDSPSYSLLVDLKRRSVTPIFIASGHHRPVGTMDIDGDGLCVLCASVVNGIGRIRHPSS